MKELEKIIGTYYENNEPVTSSDLFDLQSVKDIAIAYAKLCLEKAAEEALCKKKHDRHFEIYIDDYFVTEDGCITVHKESITNIELP